MHNEKNLMKYIEHRQQGIDTIVFSERLTEKQVWLERLMLNLRRASGLKIVDLMHGVPPEQQQELTQKIDSLCQHGFVEIRDAILRLTPRGLAVENEVIVRLIG